DHRLCWSQLGRTSFCQYLGHHDPHSWPRSCQVEHPPQPVRDIASVQSRPPVSAFQCVRSYGCPLPDRSAKPRGDCAPRGQPRSAHQLECAYSSRSLPRRRPCLVDFSLPFLTSPLLLTTFSSTCRRPLALLAPRPQRQGVFLLPPTVRLLKSMRLATVTRQPLLLPQITSCPIASVSSAL